MYIYIYIINIIYHDISNILNYTVIYVAHVIDIERIDIHASHPLYIYIYVYIYICIIYMCRNRLMA